MGDESDKPDSYWREKLSPEQYHICRERGTERPFSGEFYATKVDGIYHCACCGAELFDSNTKYDSGSGWPSFWDVLNNGNVVKETDTSHGMIRTEVHCAKCGAHLGHVFPDGPEPTGLRFCINSASLELEKRKGES